MDLKSPLVATEEERALFAELGAWDLSVLPPALRRALAQAWTQAAQAEHASIASFSRFSLQLLAVGAPPELVAGAHLAALDEVRHARISFALASAYAGVPLGPAPLAIPSDALAGLTLTQAATSTAAEGCVGETLAALEAEAARDLATAPAPRLALTMIARDELQHAKLAWAFVRWAVTTGGEPTRQAVAGELERCFRSFEGSAATTIRSDVDDELLAAHGRLSEQQRLALQRRVLAESIVPAARELVGSG